MSLIKKNKKKGILFWITGLSGSGKSSIAKNIFNQIRKEYGPTILFHGNNIRSIFELKDYSFSGRQRAGLMYSKLFKKIIDHKINVIFAGIVLIEKVRKYNRQNIDNYIEIYIKTDKKNIIKKKYKKLYFKTKNLVGLKIKPEFPKNPEIIIKNDLNKNIKKLSQDLIKNIKKKIK